MALMSDLWSECPLTKSCHRLLNVIQTICPHLLRYITVAAIVNTKRQASIKEVTKDLKELIRILKQEREQYVDPVTEFLLALEVDFDTEGVMKNLRLSERIVASDYFLSQVYGEFVEQARVLILETLSRINKCVELGYVS